MTFGHLAGELVRRVSGKDLMEYLHDNILDPLEVSDFFIGLPDSVTDSDGKLVPFDQSRVADLVDGDGATDAGTPGSFNRPEVRRAVIPSANGETLQYRSRLGCILLKATARALLAGHTNGRALARIYSAVANPPNSMISPQHIDLMRSTHSPPHSADDDVSVGQGMRFGLGFRLSAPDEEMDYWFGPNMGSFGHTGAGGASVGFADPETNLSFGYTASRFDQSASYDGSERRKHIIRAVYKVVEEIWED